MMAPALPFIAVAATVIGTGVAAYGAIQQGQAAKQAGRAQQQAAAYQAAVQQNNAAIALRNARLSEQSARQAETAGSQDVTAQARRTRALIGQQRVSAASRGLDVNSGSALDLTSSSADLGRESVANITDTAARRAAGFRIQGLNYENEAMNQSTSASLSLARGEDAANAGSAAQTAGYINAGSTILTGAGRAASQYTDMMRTGVPFGTTAGTTVPVTV
jgi:hypothetical protein